MKRNSITLIHKENHCPIGKLKIENSKIYVKMKESCLEVKGTLGNVRVFDMTNYPETIDGNLEW